MFGLRPGLVGRSDSELRFFGQVSTSCDTKSAMAILTSPCPNCGRQIDSAARRCQHCEYLPAVGWSVGLHTAVQHRTKIERLKASLRA